MNYLQCELISSGRGISRRGGFRMSSQVHYKRGDSDESISDLEENGFAPSLFLSKNAVQGLQELDASDDLDDFPKALTTILKALSKAAEAKGAAQKEAAEWKKKYEIEKAQNSRLLHRGSDDLSSESDVSDQQEILSPDPVDTPIPDNDHSEKCCGKHGICAHQFLCDKTSESDFKIVPSKVIRKASFRLAWGFNGDKSQHKHDVVSFDKGDITTAQRSSKQIALKWESQPQTLVLLTKPNSKSVQIMCAQMIRWLKDHKKLDIIVEPRVRDELMSESSYFDFVQTWEKDDEILDLHTKVDLVITLGGDGTVLWAASLFKGPVPPVVSFSMGSLGFMTPFQIEHYQKHLDLILMEPFSITLRHRLQCHVVKKGSEDDNVEPILVLNEVTIDRGISSYLTNLECYCDGSFVTSVQGDGLILSTTSGSTAYSLAAGGSVVHPQVPGILFTPICPHSLSFRPLILPEYVTVRVQVPYKSRGQAWASFDGKGRIQLSAGDALICSMAAWPVPTACHDDSTNDFFGSINNSLHWNLRKTQSFDGPVDPVD